MVREWIAKSIIKIESRFRGERLSPKGEMLEIYCRGVLEGSDRYVEAYEDIIRSTMEYNEVDRLEACRILSIILDGIR